MRLYLCRSQLPAYQEASIKSQFNKKSLDLTEQDLFKRQKEHDQIDEKDWGHVWKHEQVKGQQSERHQLKNDYRRLVHK